MLVTPPSRLVNGWMSNQGEAYAVATHLFCKHRIQFRRLGDCRHPIYMAGVPPPPTCRSVAAFAHAAQLPLHWLAFLVSGVVSPHLPSTFAHSAAYGDVIASTLALLSLLLLPRVAGVVIAWVFNLWGTVDVLNAFYQANHAGLLAGQLGATYFIPTVIVPLLLITPKAPLQRLTEGLSMMRAGALDICRPMMVR